MKCFICDDWIEIDDEFWQVNDEAAHHACINLIEKGLIINKISFDDEN